jgi:uncharacterized repeat protein (TIGR02543 family)
MFYHLIFIDDKSRMYYYSTEEGIMIKKILLLLLVGLVVFNDVSLLKSNYEEPVVTETKVTEPDIAITTTNVLPASNAFAQTFKVTETGLLKSFTISTIKTQPNAAASIIIYLYALSNPANITSFTTADENLLAISDVVSIAKNKTENDLEFTFSDPAVFHKDTTYLLVIRSAVNQFSVKVSTNNTYYSGQLFTNSSGTNWNSSNDKDLVFSSNAKIRFEASFDANGGSPTPDTQNLLYGDKINKPEDPTKDGYTFCGWEVDGVEWDFDNDTIDENGVALTACWDLEEYSITYFLNSGVNNQSNPTTYTIEDEFDFLDATRAGYTFEGWFTASLDGTLVPSVSLGSTGNLTLYAKWTAHTNIPYSVKHYRQLKDGTYALVDTESLEGTTNSIVSGVAHDWLGFAHNSEHADSKVSGTVAADGSLVLSLYYDRLPQELEIVPEESVTESKIDGLDDGIEIPELDDEDVYKVKVELVVEVISDPAVLEIVDNAISANNFNLLKVLDLNLLKTVTYFDGSEETSNINREQIKKFLTITLKLDEEFIGISNLKVAYVSDDGLVVEFLDTEVFQDEVTGEWYVSFQTNHFSNYALINPAEELPQTGDASGWATLLLLLGAFIVLGNKKQEVQE